MKAKNMTTNANAMTRTPNATAQLLRTPLGKIALALVGLPINPTRPADRPMPQPQAQLKGLVSDVNSDSNSSPSPSK